MGKKEEALVIDGTVTESFANAQFRVHLDNGSEVLAYLSGVMRKFRVRVVPGDIVQVELSPYDLSRGRIIFRER